MSETPVFWIEGMKIYALALNTFREAIRNQILYSLVFFAVLVVLLAALFGSASVGDQMKFVKDFALMSISLFGVIIAIVLGVNLLQKELGRRTILNILSKPVSRAEFIAGKFAGLLATLTLIVTLMCATLLGFLALYEGRMDWGLALAAFAMLLEIMVLIAAALFFSCMVVTPTLAGLFCAAIFIAGRSSGYLHFFVDPSFSPIIKVTAQVLYWVLPHLHKFNLADRVVYGQTVSAEHVGLLIVYAIGYAGTLLTLALLLFSWREFK